MAEESLRSAIDSIRSRLHEELEAQLEQLSSRHQAEIEAVRRATEAQAEQRWASKVDAVRSEWTARLESEVATVRGEAERRMVAESMRLRVEAEQAAAESAAAVREELEQALARERERADSEIAIARQQLAGERDTLQAELDRVRGELEAARRDAAASRQELEGIGRDSAAARQELDAARRDAATARQEAEGVRHELAAAGRARDEAVSARSALSTEIEHHRRSAEHEARRYEEAAAAVAEARVTERQTQLAIVERLLTAIRSMDAGRSLSDVLSALTSSAAAEAPRVALFVVNGTELRGWKTAGFDGDASALQATMDDEGLLGDVLRRREPVVTADGAGPGAPKFAALPRGRAAIAVPLLVGAQPVAVLYADDASDGTPAAPASWPEAIQILGRHASVNLAHLTAARAAEAMRRSLAPSAASGAAPAAGAPAEDGNSARRYARLLVSEIKLYNEAAVRVGRQKRDLLERLKPEIDRARKLYAQRISSAVDSRGALFQQELVQTLADGDPTLLGNPV